MPNRVTAIVRSIVGLKNIAGDQIDPARKQDIDALLDQFKDAFTRIKERRFLNTEEVRYDFSGLEPSGSTYVGLAPSGTLTDATSWYIVRTDYDADKRPSRDRFRSGVAWDDRADGWA